MAVLVQLLTLSVVGLVAPAGVAYTLQLLHCVPKSSPAMERVLPAVTAVPGVVVGVTAPEHVDEEGEHEIARFNLHR